MSQNPSPNAALLLFLSAGTHRLTTGVKFGQASPNVAVSFGWDLVLEDTSLSDDGSAVVTGRSLASGWNYLAGLESGSQEAAECSEKILSGVLQQGVMPGAAFDACLAAISEAIDNPSTTLPDKLSAVVAHNTEFVLSVLRKYEDHPLVELLEHPEHPVRRVCLCWDRRVRASMPVAPDHVSTSAGNRPVRFVDLLNRFGLGQPGEEATDQLRLTVRLYMLLRNEGTLGPVSTMEHDSDPRTPLMYLNVPFADKAEAKKLGASFDFVKKRWFFSVEQADMLRSIEIPEAWRQSAAHPQPKRQREDEE